MVNGNGNGFDRWLEQELQRATAGNGGPSPSAGQAAYHAASLQGGTHMSVLAKAASVVSAKGAVGLAVAVLAVGAAGAATEASVTGSTNPSNWGQQVVQQVQKCKDALAPGSHGIGQCVSTFAKQNGKDVSSQHSASSARENHPSSTDHPTGKPAGTTGGSTSHPTGPPTNH